MKVKWAMFWYLVAQLILSAIIGTLTLLATADNPWDGDEFFKGPIVGWSSWGGGQGMTAVWAKLRELVEH